MSGSMLRIFIIMMFIILFGAGLAHSQEEVPHSLIIDVGESMEGEGVLVWDGLESEKHSGIQYYFDKSVALRAQRVFPLTERAKERTARFLGDEVFEGIVVYLLGDMNSYYMHRIGRRGAPEWAAGLALLEDGIILIKLEAKGTERIEPGRTLAHEFNHIALRRFVRGAFLPTWLYEGFAVYSTEEWNLERAETLGKGRMLASLLDFSQLVDHFPADGFDVSLAYAQSAHFVGWLIEQYGAEKFIGWLEKIRDGKVYSDAFRESYGIGVVNAELKWREGVSEIKYGWLSVFMSSDAVFFGIGVLGFIAILLFWVRSRRRKKRQYENHPSVEELPENLRRFKPFL